VVVEGNGTALPSTSCPTGLRAQLPSPHRALLRYKKMQFEILKGFCLRVALILTPILTQALTRVINKEELKPKHVIGGTLVSARIALASI